ncbi:GNAT family N-acetyltransferase [[Mycobacterium] manitobense]|nr:GNAT family protein [[Mycobacterium] manitobense]
MIDVVLMPATVEHLTALRADRNAFGELLGADVPDGWPEFPESVEFTITQLTEHPHQADWWMHFFLADNGARLVGSGGFVGPPHNGVVEIGYEIAPEFRGRGLATAAARAMIGKAKASSNRLSTIVAHTLPDHNASTSVLRRLGFRHAGEVEDPDEGTVWRWELPVDLATAD